MLPSRGGLFAEPFASFGPSALQYIAPARRAHPLSEAVRAFSFYVRRRLEVLLHPERPL